MEKCRFYLSLAITLQVLTLSTESVLDLFLLRDSKSHL